MLSTIFYKLLYMSIVASVIGLVIILIRKFLYKYISPKIIYVMWIVFLLALVVPPFISTKISVYNYIDISEIDDLSYNFNTSSEELGSNVVLQTQRDNLEIADEEESNKTTDQSTKPIPNLKYVFPRLKDLLPIIWISGVGILGLTYIVSNIVFAIKIGNKKFEDERIKEILANSKKRFNIRRKIELINQDLVKTPAVIGIIKPKVLVSENLKNNTDAEIDYIFRHELAHLKRNDNLINCVLMFLRTIHWFNPVVWIVIKEIKKDMEFTADEKAVRGLELNDRKEYCKLLVNLSKNSSTSFMEKAIGIANDKNDLEKRINMIKLSDKLSKHPVFASMLVFVIIGLICLILYTNNYYQPSLDTPPKLYVQTSTGNVKELLLTKYEWINGDKVTTYDIGFDPNTYEFKDENILYDMFFYDDYDDYEYLLYTEPRYKMSYINKTLYSSQEGAGNFVHTKYLTPNINDVKYKDFSFPSGISELEVYFPNGSVAHYIIKKEEYYFENREIVDKYLDIDINDKDKIEALVKTFHMKEFLNEIKVENNILYLNYEYAQDPAYSYKMSTILFTAIPKLEKIVVSFNHKDVFFSIEDDRYKFSESLEITRDTADQNSEITIENLQKIIKESKR